MHYRKCSKKGTTGEEQEQVGDEGSGGRKGREG